MDRRAFIVTLLATYGCGQKEEPKKPAEAPKAAATNAQPPEKIARLGFLAGFPRLMTQDAASTTIIERLRELGYVEGRNLVIDYRHAETEVLLRELAGQLVATGIQVIYAQGPYALRAACAASATIPIVGLDHESDPVAAGYAVSLARPGGNVTGVFLDQSGISAKQLELLGELVPGLTRVAVLYDAEVASAQRESVEGAARRLGVTIAPIVWRGPDVLPAALRVRNAGRRARTHRAFVPAHLRTGKSTAGSRCRIEEALACNHAVVELGARWLARHLRPCAKRHVP